MSSVNWRRWFVVSIATFAFAISFTIGNALSGIGSINLSDPMYDAFGVRPLFHILKVIDAFDAPLSVISFVASCFTFLAKGIWPSGY